MVMGSVALSGLGIGTQNKIKKNSLQFKREQNNFSNCIVITSDDGDIHSANGARAVCTQVEVEGKSDR